jgi:hypothetical protein
VNFYNKQHYTFLKFTIQPLAFFLNKKKRKTPKPGSWHHPTPVMQIVVIHAEHVFLPEGEDKKAGKHIVCQIALEKHDFVKMLKSIS